MPIWLFYITLVFAQVCGYITVTVCHITVAQLWVSSCVWSMPVSPQSINSSNRERTVWRGQYHSAVHNHQNKCLHTFLQNTDMLKLCISLCCNLCFIGLIFSCVLLQRCAYGRIRFRHKNHLVGVRKTRFGFKYLHCRHNVPMKVPDFNATNTAELCLTVSFEHMVRKCPTC